MFMFLESEELQNKERKGRERREKKQEKFSLCFWITIQLF